MATPYSLCLDNVQVDVHAKHQSREQGNRYLMWGLTFAADNRVNSLLLPDDDKRQASEIDPKKLLPSMTDYQRRRTRMIALVTRVLSNIIARIRPGARQQANAAIQHDFSEEMAKKSKVVNIILEKRKRHSKIGFLPTNLQTNISWKSLLRITVMHFIQLAHNKQVAWYTIWNYIYVI